MIKFEKNEAGTQGSNISNIPPGSYFQFVADNVDHNIRTLNGLNTFRGVGLIACITPKDKDMPCRVISKKDVQTKEILQIGRIDVQFFKANKKHSNRPFIFYHPLQSDM